jgi:hypothetical protein
MVLIIEGTDQLMHIVVTIHNAVVDYTNVTFCLGINRRKYIFLAIASNTLLLAGYLLPHKRYVQHLDDNLTESQSNERNEGVVERQRISCEVGVHLKNLDKDLLGNVLCDLEVWHFQTFLVLIQQHLQSSVTKPLFFLNPKQ